MAAQVLAGGTGKTGQSCGAVNAAGRSTIVGGVAVLAPSFCAWKGDTCSQLHLEIRTLIDQPPGARAASSNCIPQLASQPVLNGSRALSPGLVPELPKVGAELRSLSLVVALHRFRFSSSSSSRTSPGRCHLALPHSPGNSSPAPAPAFAATLPSPSAELALQRKPARHHVRHQTRAWTTDLRLSSVAPSSLSLAHCF